jgi:hypothetical protein
MGAYSAGRHGAFGIFILAVSQDLLRFEGS